MSIAIEDRPLATNSLASVIAIWERVLRLSPINANDNFFELGGDSLLALDLFLAIERKIGRTLPIAAIYDAATPAAVTELLKRADMTRCSPLVLLKPGEDGAPLFIVHGIGGNVIELAQLGKAIDTDRPVYAIQAKGVDGVEEPLDRIEDMAEYNLVAVRETQPNGPYFLAGYSFGGLIAMEMARRLQAAGEDVAFLGFIDTFAHPETFPKLSRYTMRARIAFDAVRSMPPRQAAAFFFDRLVRGRKRGSTLNALPTHLTGTNTGDAVRKVHDAALTALIRYRPNFYHGRITFLRAEDSLFPIDPARIWRKLADQFHIVRVAGSHSSMVKEHVGSLAGALTQCLRNASATS